MQQHARSDALEAAQGEIAELAAVEPDLEQSGAAREPGPVQEVLVGPRDLEQQLALGRVPVVGQEAVVAFETCGSRGQGRGRLCSG